MSTNHDLYLDLCAALALGSIDPADRRVLEEHLAGGCAACHALLQDLCAPIEALAASVDPVKPSRGLKARTMVAVAQAGHVGGADRPDAAPERAAARPASAVPGWVWIALAVLAAAAAVGWWRASVNAEKPATEQAPERDVPPSEAERFAQFVVSAPNAKRMTLDRLPDAPPGVEVEVVWDEARRRAAVRVVKGAPPAGKALELWTLRDKKAYSEGLVSGSGYAFIENTGARPALSGFAVSVEPPQGAKDRETPTTVALIKQL